MTYRPPSVEITQTQVTTSVNAVIADLTSGIIGAAYKVVPQDEVNYDFIEISPTGTGIGPAGTGIGISLKETQSELLSANDGLLLDPNSVFVEFVSQVGETIPFTGTLTVVDNTVVLTLPDGKTAADVFPRALDAQNKQYRPRISYRAMYTKRNRETLIQTIDDVKQSVGDNLTTINPLGFAASLVLANSPASFMVYPTVSNDSAGFSEALDSLESSDVYSVSVLTQDSVTTLGLVKQWVTSRSLPENSRPTKLYFSPKIVWYVDGVASSDSQLAVTFDSSYATYNEAFEFPLYKLKKTDKKITAEGIAAAATQCLDRRVTYVHPDMSWVRETRHVAQLKPAYVEAVSEVSGGKAVLAASLTLSDGTVYPAGTIVNTAVYNKLISLNAQGKPLLSNFSAVSVYVPVPGYMEATKQAALVSALNPSDPKTGVPTYGTNKIDFSENFFGEEYTNIIAGGGNTVISQITASVLPSSRHHLSTDMTTTESREDNITHQVDCVSINLKIGLRGLVGRWKQNAKYYKILEATLRSYADEFKAKEFAKDVQILEVKQSTVSPDKVLVVTKVLPFYAANYIDLQVQY